MSKYTRLGIACVHCGAELSGKWGDVRVVAGRTRPVDLVHAGSGRVACRPTYALASPVTAGKALMEAEAFDETCAFLRPQALADMPEDQL